MRLLIALFLISSSAHAASTLKVDVINAEVGVLDYTDRPTLCVTTVREVSTGKLLGIVEDITDCFWTRQARRSHATTLELPRHAFTKVEAGEMLLHLQGFDSQLEFLWSNAD
jgi:hypothetical protein